MDKFKIGDRVKVIKKYEGANPGTEGVIGGKKKSNRYYPVRITKRVGLTGNNLWHCEGVFEDNVGYCISEDCLKLIGARNLMELINET